MSRGHVDGGNTVPRTLIWAVAAMCSVAAAAYGLVSPSLLALGLVASGLVLAAAVRNLQSQGVPWVLGALVLFGGLLLLILLQATLDYPLSDFQTLRSEAELCALPDCEAASQALAVALIFCIGFVIGCAIGGDYRSALALVKSTVLLGFFLVAGTLILFLADPSLLLGSTRRAYLGYYTHGFVNRNTAATYLGLMGILSLGLVLRAVRRLVEQQVWAGTGGAVDRWSSILRGIVPRVAMTFLFVAGLAMTGSRGGILLFVPAALLMIVFSVPWGKVGAKSYVLLGVLATLLMVFLFFGRSDLAGRFERTVSPQGEPRMEIYSSTLEMINRHPWTGIGFGAYPTTYPQYRSPLIAPDGVVDKAHSVPLELVATLGLPFSAIVGLAWLWLGLHFLWSLTWRRTQRTAPILGIGAWSFVTLHGLVDFSPQVPAVALTMSVILGALAVQSANRG